MEQLPDFPCGKACGRAAVAWVNVGFRLIKGKPPCSQWSPLCDECAAKAELPLWSDQTQLPRIPMVQFV